MNMRSLEGVRVVDFSWVRAGPWATRWLGALGAEIIKVEWPENERGRMTGQMTPPSIERTPNTNGNFNDTNANKRGITVNVRTPRGLELVKRLIGTADVVIENFSSRVFSNWGLSFDELKAIKEDIIYVSMSGFGHTGRHHRYKTFGPVAQALAGLTFSSGLPDREPAGWGWSYLDDTGGLYGAMGVLNALYFRAKTGRGQHVDQSQMVMGVTQNGPAILDKTVNGRAARRPGFPPGNRAHTPGRERVDNYRGGAAAPHNAYRTAPGGYNDWCVIACFDDADFAALVDAMGSPDWAGDARFATLESRLDHQDELDGHIEAWTRTLDKYDVMTACQAKGVAASAVQSSADRFDNDPQLGEHGMYRSVDHPDLGRFAVQGAPFSMSAARTDNVSAAPRIGADNRAVFVDEMGISEDEFRLGYEDGTFWPADAARHAYIEEMIA